MKVLSEHLANYGTPLGSETNDPHITTVCHYAAHTVVRAASRNDVISHSLLAIGDQDLDEVIRQDRLDYAEEQAYEEELMKQFAEKRQSNTGVVYDLPSPIQPMEVFTVSHSEQVAS